MIFDVLCVLIYAGGCWQFEEEEIGLFRALIWPYYLGKRLASYAARDYLNSQEDKTHE